MAKKLKSWAIGDRFLIPLSDGTCGAGQVLATEPLTLKNGPLCVFFGERHFDEKLTDGAAFLFLAEPIAALFVTRDLLDSGAWPIIDTGMTMDPQRFVPDLAGRRKQGFIGTKIIGSGNVITLMNAWFGLSAWDVMHDPNYLRALLLPSVYSRANH